MRKDKLTGAEICLRNIGFMESMVKARLSSKECYLKKCIPADDLTLKERAWTVLAYAGLYNATGEKKYLNKARTESRKLVKECYPGTFTCLPVIIAQRKAPIVLDAEWKKDYLDDLLYIELSEVSAYDISLFAYASAIDYRKLVEQNPEKKRGSRFVNTINALTQSEEALSSADAGFWGLDGRRHNQGVCLMHLAWFELYDVLKDNEDVIYRLAGKRYDWGGDDRQAERLLEKKPEAAFLDPSIEFFNSVDFSEQVEAKQSEVFLVPLSELLPCAEALFYLSDLSRNKRFLGDGLSIMEHVIKSRWDSQESLKFNGDDGLLSTGCRFRGASKLACYDTPKKLSENSYGIYLFSTVRDHEFVVPLGLQVKWFADPSEDPGFHATTSTSSSTTTSVSESTMLPPESGGKKKNYMVFYYAVFGIILFSIYLYLKSGG